LIQIYSDIFKLIFFLFYPDKKKKLQAEPQNARLQRTKTCFFFVSRILQMNSLEIIIKNNEPEEEKPPTSLKRALEAARVSVRAAEKTPFRQLRQRSGTGV